jgi:leucyl aminopeptidase
MATTPSISFAKPAAPKAGSVVVLIGEDKALPDTVTAIDPEKALERAFAITEFGGKLASSVELVAPAGNGLDRLVAVGVGKADKLDEQAWLRLGGVAMAQLKKSTDATVVFDVAGATPSGADAAAFALGMVLRGYSFDKYKTKKDSGDNGEEKPKTQKVILQLADLSAAKKAFKQAEAAAEGVILARDLVNEPANLLGPVEFAARANELAALGVEVEVLTEKEMKKLGMGALLGVAQGSPRGARVVVMQWYGGKPGDRPIAFVG